MHETYADTTIAFVDAKVAAAMCKGGVIAYVVDQMSGVTDKWILDHGVPNMVRKGIDEQVCKVLGRSILWRVFDWSGDDAFPPHRREQIMSAYQDLGACNVLEEGCNPIKRKPLIISGHDTEVIIDLLLDDGSDEHLVWMFEEAWLYRTKRYVCFLHIYFTCIVTLLMLCRS